MPEKALHKASASELAAAMRARKLSPVELTKHCLERIERLNPSVNAFVFVDHEAALSAAQFAEDRFQRDADQPLLLGLPMSVKDNIMVAGMRSTSGSKLFADYIPTEDSGIVTNARRAGATILGKTNTPAFGWTGTTDNLLFGPTRNPFDNSLTPGGSSGGAAVSAALGLAPLNVGTDGGGSLRIPAAFTGTVGFKPTHGRIPDTPPHPHWLIQHYGPVAQSVADVALMYDALALPSPLDPHSLPATTESARVALGEPLRSRKAVFTTQLGWIGTVDPEIEATCREAALSLREVGWEVEERALAWPDPSPFANVIAGVGLAHRLKDYRDRLDDIEPGIIRILETSDRLPAHAFYEAYLERNRWCAHAHSLLEDIDFLITPTTASLPFPVGQLAPDSIAGQPVPASGWTAFPRAFNLSGQPAISVPAGKSRSGLPIGLQIVGKRFSDISVLRAASTFEKLRPWRTPGLSL